MAQERLNQRGFTLLEIVVVLAVMGILMLMMMPNFYKMTSGQQLTGVAYQMHSDSRWTQEMAKIRQENVQLSVYRYASGQCVYYIKAINHENGNMGVTLKRVDLPVGVQVDFNSDTTIEFLADGSIRQNGHLTLRAEDKRYYLFFYQSGRVRLTYAPN